MCVGIALALSQIPLEFYERHQLERRLYYSGGELEVQFLHGDAPRVLPVRHEGQLILARWGAGRGEGSALPPTGWTWQATMESGYWGEAGAVPVVIPAKLGLEKGTWFPILVGIRGLLVHDERGAPVVFMVCEPSTHYFRIMTGCDRMPALVDQRY